MNPWIDVAGWTLVHFLWQGTLVAALALAALWLLRDRSPQSRYFVACAALVTMLAAPAITAAVLANDLPARGPYGLTRTIHTAVPPSSPESASAPVAIVTARRVVSTEPQAAAAVSWTPVIVMLWIAGVAILLVRLAGGCWRISRLHRASRTAFSSAWAGAAARIATTIGLSRAIRVVDTALVDTPTVIGVFRPVILLPIAAFAGLSPSQVEAILAHELAHIRRHDFLVNVLQTIAETILFYHPAVWWISNRIRVEREHCCDVVALSVCGDAVSYAEALVELETWRTVHAPLAVAATGGPLLTRVRRLLGKPGDDAPRPVGVRIVAGLAALAICVAGASHYLFAAQPNVVVSKRTVDVKDPAAWSMIFNQGDSTMRFIGYSGRDLVRFAYQVPAARVVGGPRWIDEQIRQIIVNLDAAPRADQMPGIVRQALEDKLQLKTHVEQRNFPVLALTRVGADTALSPRLRPATRPCFDLAQWVAAGQPPDQVPSESHRVPVCGGELDSPVGWTQYSSITMAQFAEQLRGYLHGYIFAPPLNTPHVGPVLVGLNAPDIVDRTRLSGRYDLEFTAFYPTAALMSRFPFLKNVFEPLGFASIPRALADQLGLALVESEAPYDVIVIDSAERP